jgi:hypothetical protein
LTELDDEMATGIFCSLICHLQSISTTEKHLNDYLVYVACDGTVVMFGSRGGVKKLRKEQSQTGISSL